ncbi:hypothetical protein EJD97_004551 [Solanum chilense]|uniref:Retrotransposon gag domain-containing protein n=1 Tax=Solanum chilense TaxID=4083 RepID=A0A6N2BU00_SOLCI|nr:hypothetical protein EJD97_004551 [Solanum chilense]
MSVEEYSLKFSMVSKYPASLLSNPRDEISRFLTGVTNLVREEYHTTMLHDDITLSRLVVYAQSIEQSKHRRIARNLKRSGSNDQGQSRFKQRAQTQDESRSAKVKFERVDRGRKGKRVAPKVPKVEAPSKRHFYTLQTKTDYDDDDANFFLLLEYEFLLCRGVWGVVAIELH